MSYTRAVLNTGWTLGIPASLVTNGQLLRAAADELAELAPAKIGISLDAASPAAHDLVRGVTGAWAAAVDGVQYARKVLPSKTSLAVISVLLPSKCAELEKMPSLLRDLGIGHWIVNPLHVIGRGRPGGVAGGRQRLLENLTRLQGAADCAGIRLTVDDELGCLQSEFGSAGMTGLENIHIRTLPAGVELVRLAPSGQCSIGRDILAQERPDTPYWRPGDTDAGDFIAGLRYFANVEYRTAA